MFETIVDNLVTIMKAKQTKDFATDSIENIARYCLAGDAESGIKEITEAIRYAGSIKDILFWSNIKKWLEDTYKDPDLEVRLSAKFTQDEAKYKEYTKRQLQYIAQIDEEGKIELYANLTRAWLMGYIDKTLYFKMAYLLRVYTLEELEYLKNNYTENNINKLNYYIKEFSLYGLIDIISMTDQGNSEYRYSMLAKVFRSICLCYEQEKINFYNLGLEDLEVVNTKTCLEWIEF